MEVLSTVGRHSRSTLCFPGCLHWWRISIARTEGRDGAENCNELRIGVRYIRWVVDVVVGPAVRSAQVVSWTSPTWGHLDSAELGV